MPIHKDFHSMLDGMTGQYCTGESEETSKTETAEGYPGKTCRKALSVFYATCKERGLDYSQSMPKEKVREHVEAILPFKVLEKIVDKPLKIRGIAMTAGMSRNFNIYTPEELQVFANKLVSAPVYVEHVAVPNACGKVTKTDWDGQNLWYEAEIFEGDVADKIRKGLIQHVSVGADYDVLDVVDGKVPHGLHNAELSLVAVPGIPETNVQIFESLRLSEQAPASVSAGQNMNEEDLKRLAWKIEERVKATLREQMQLLKCPKCGQTFDYYQWQSNNWTCPNKDCGVEVVPPEPVLLKVREQADDREKARQEQQQRSQKYRIGVKDGGNVTKPGEYANLSDDQFADPVNYRYPIDEEHVQAALAYFNQSDNRRAGGYSHEEAVKIMAKIIQAALGAGKEVSWQPEDPVYRDLPEDLKSKLSGYTKENLAEKLAATEKELTETKVKLAEAQKLLDQQKDGSSLVKDPPKTMPVAEAIAVLEGLLPSPAVERSTLGMQRECQAIRSEIFRLKERLKSG